MNTKDFLKSKKLYMVHCVLGYERSNDTVAINAGIYDSATEALNALERLVQEAWYMAEFGDKMTLEEYKKENEAFIMNRLVEFNVKKPTPQDIATFYKVFDMDIRNDRFRIEKFTTNEFRTDNVVEHFG